MLKFGMIAFLVYRDVSPAGPSEREFANDPIAKIRVIVSNCLVNLNCGSRANGSKGIPALKPIVSA